MRMEQVRLPLQWYPNFRGVRKIVSTRELVVPAPETTWVVPTSIQEATEAPQQCFRGMECLAAQGRLNVRNMERGRWVFAISLAC
jgi:predicted alternative tryptophan synthase beta-subunit